VRTSDYTFANQVFYWNKTNDPRVPNRAGWPKSIEDMSYSALFWQFQVNFNLKDMWKLPKLKEKFVRTKEPILSTSRPRIEIHLLVQDNSKWKEVARTVPEGLELRQTLRQPVSCNQTFVVPSILPEYGLDMLW
jgi:hypothetical protein